MFLGAAESVGDAPVDPTVLVGGHLGLSSVHPGPDLAVVRESGSGKSIANHPFGLDAQPRLSQDGFKFYVSVICCCYYDILY